MISKFLSRPRSPSAWYFSGLLSAAVIWALPQLAANWLIGIATEDDETAIKTRTANLVRGYEQNLQFTAIRDDYVKRAIRCYMAPAFVQMMAGFTMDMAFRDASEPDRVTSTTEKIHEEDKAQLLDMLNRAGVGACVKRIRDMPWDKRPALEDVYAECMKQEEE